MNHHSAVTMRNKKPLPVSRGVDVIGEAAHAKVIADQFQKSFTVTAMACPD
jgi:hypothetical protein